MVAFAVVFVVGACQSSQPAPATTTEPPTGEGTLGENPLDLPADATAVVTGDFPVALADDVIRAVDQLSTRGAQLSVLLADGSSFSYSENSDPSAFLADIGSVDKTFTAVLVLLLVEEGLIQLDDTVDQWIEAPAVTVGQLLNHTSGIASDDPALPSVCHPGTCQSYSNSGYRFLKELVEAATGQEYAVALRARVLDPLGLSRTFYPAQEQPVGRSVIGYGAGRAESAVDVATERAGLISTAEDVARFEAALFAGELLEPGSLSMMLDVDATLRLAGSNECRPYAMGLDRHVVDALGEAWGHGGNAGSFRTAMEHLTGSGTSVVVIVNEGGPVIGDYIRSLETALARHLPAEPFDRGCDTDIALTDGVSTTTVSTRLGFDGLPAISPDGLTIAGVSDVDGDVDIVLYDLRTRTSRRVVLAGFQTTPRWSPDGTHLLFSSDEDGDQELRLLRIADDKQHVLTDNSDDDLAASFSPDGSRIVMMRSLGQSLQLWLADADGGNQHRVDGSHDNVNWPAWSPDGTQIVYTSDGVPYIIDAAGGEPFRIPINHIRVVDLPSWAPGNSIVFGSDGDLWSVAPDGSALTRLTSTSTVEEAPVWSDTGELGYQVQHRS